MVREVDKDSECEGDSQGGGFDDCRFDVFRCGDLINRKSPNRPIAISFNPSSPSSHHQPVRTEEQRNKISEH